MACKRCTRQDAGYGREEASLGARDRAEGLFPAQAAVSTTTRGAPFPSSVGISSLTILSVCYRPSNRCSSCGRSQATSAGASADGRSSSRWSANRVPTRDTLHSATCRCRAGRDRTRCQGACRVYRCPRRVRRALTDMPTPFIPTLCVPVTSLPKRTCLISHTPRSLYPHARSPASPPRLNVSRVRRANPRAFVQSGGAASLSTFGQGLMR